MEGVVAALHLLFQQLYCEIGHIARHHLRRTEGSLETDKTVLQVN